MNTYAHIDSNGTLQGYLKTSLTISDPALILTDTDISILHGWIGTKKLEGAAFVDIIPSVRVVSKFAFLTRFTAAERLAILAESRTDDRIADYLQLVTVADQIDLDLPVMSLGMDLLISLGLIEASRKAEILA